jgi:hypothetical protein
MILVACDTGKPMQFEGKVDPVLVDRGRPPEALEAPEQLGLDLDVVAQHRRAPGPERYVRAPRGLL